MAVFTPNLAWPGSRVPYEADCSETEQWLLEINRVVGFPLLVPKGRSDTDYVLAAQSGHGVSETIGYIKSKGAHRISGSRKFVMQHELMHALGFHHEQLHAKGPWGAFGTKVKSADKIDRKLLDEWGVNMVPEASRIETPVATPPKTRSLEESMPAKKEAVPTGGHARRSSISSGQVVKIAKNEEAIQQHCRAFDEAMKDNNILHFGECDFDSVMMYGEMKRAAEKLRLPMVRTSKSTKADQLSNGDVLALKAFYPCLVLILAPATTTA